VLCSKLNTVSLFAVFFGVPEIFLRVHVGDLNGVIGDLTRLIDVGSRVFWGVSEHVYTGDVWDIRGDFFNYYLVLYILVDIEPPSFGGEA